MSLVFYTNPMSRGRIVRWMLEEIGEPYETIVLDYGDAMKSPDYLAINPMGKVPTLVHGDAVVTETGAICAYLADAFSEVGLAPRDSERAAYHRWMYFAAGPVEAATSNRSLGVEPDEQQSGMLGYGSFDLTYQTLLFALADKPFICGERFTAADVYFGSEVMFGLQFKSLQEHPLLCAYRDRLTERSAYQRASALDDAALADVS